MDEEKRISGKSPASSWVIIAIAVIAVGSALAGIFWPWLRDILGDKDRGAIVGALRFDDFSLGSTTTIKL